MYVYGSNCACTLLNHTHKFTFINQIGKILSRRTRETINQIGVALIIVEITNNNIILLCVKKLQDINLIC